MLETYTIFSTIAVSIFIEAMPFLAIGALLSAVIEVYVPTDKLMRFVPEGVGRSIALGVGAGFVLPTCECGVVPIARRLMHKGVPAHMAISYMLAAPIINPVVLISTYIAFRYSLTMLLGRILISAVVAAAIGFYTSRASKVLTAGANHEAEGGDDHSHDHSVMAASGKLRSTLVHAANEFIDMGKFLILGSLVAAFFKTLMPAEVMAFFSANLLMSICGMMLLAILLSICSEADAFVAASFITFPSASQMAFVTIGPMVDLKLIGMYAATFQPRMVAALIIGPTLLILGLSLIFGIFAS